MFRQYKLRNWLRLLLSLCVPRTNPISKQDREIAARIKEFRQGIKCTRSYLASQMDIAPAAITRIELGRVPLKYNLARLLFVCLEINPYWAATGKGIPQGFVWFPSTNDLKEPENATFSEVFHKHLLPIFDNKKSDSESETVFRFQHGELNADQMRYLFQSVPDGYARKLEEHINKSVSDFMSKCPVDDPKRILQRSLWYERADIRFKAKIAQEKEARKNQYLTDAETPVKQLDVKPQLPSLLARLKTATKETGRMSALANFLDVPLASVSRWLSGKREPGGEVTLKLLQWVEQQERQK